MEIQQYGYLSVCTAKHLSDFGQAHTVNGYNNYKQFTKSDLGKAIRDKIQEMKFSGDGIVTAIINSQQTIAEQVFRDFGFGESEWCYSKKHRHTPTKLFWAGVRNLSLDDLNNKIDEYEREEGKNKKKRTPVRPERGTRYRDEFGNWKDETTPNRGDRSRVRSPFMGAAITNLRGEKYTEDGNYVPDRILQDRSVTRGNPVRLGDDATVPVRLEVIHTHERDDEGIPTYRVGERRHGQNILVGNDWNRYRFTCARAARKFAWWLVENGYVSNP